MSHRQRNIRRAVRGFTLVEMMAVVFIIGLLATASTLVIVDQINKAKVKAAQAEISTFGQAIDLFEMDSGRYPTEEEGLDALVNEPADASDYPPRGYLKRREIPKDPWKNDYVYMLRETESGEEYLIVSYGKGGKPGGEGFAADIASRGEDLSEWMLGGD